MFGKSIRGENLQTGSFSIAPSAEVADRAGAGDKVLEPRVPIGATKGCTSPTVFDAVVIDRRASATILDPELAPLGEGSIGESSNPKDSERSSDQWLLPTPSPARVFGVKSAGYANIEPLPR